MVEQRGFVLMSVLWVALLIGMIFSQVWHQARSLLSHWHHVEQQHQVRLLAEMMLHKINIPHDIPARCDGWQQSLQSDQLSILPWRAQVIPEGFPQHWRVFTAVVCYRQIEQRVWWRKVVRIQMPDWQAIFSQVT